MKIDYEITVNVSNLTHEEKKRVQDAFFKLGFVWWDGTNYSCLNKGCYTNTFKGNIVTQYIMWTDESTKPTHTVDELLELAGMKTNLKPFDLEKALAGDPVVTRDGSEVTQVTLFECEGQFPVMAVVAGELEGFTKTGEYFTSGEASGFDLFLKPSTEIVNGFEINSPEKVEPKDGDLAFLVNLLHTNLYIAPRWYSTNGQYLMLLERGLVYLNKEDAIAKGKALLGINPYERQ